MTDELPPRVNPGHLKVVQFSERVEDDTVEVPKEVVGMLEDLLAKAKTGEVQGFAVVWVDKDNAVSNWWRYAPSKVHHISSGVGRLFYRFQRQHDDHEALSDPPRVTPEGKDK